MIYEEIQESFTQKCFIIYDFFFVNSSKQHGSQDVIYQFECNLDYIKFIVDKASLIDEPCLSS